MIVSRFRKSNHKEKIEAKVDFNDDKKTIKELKKSSKTLNNKLYINTDVFNKFI